MQQSRMCVRVCQRTRALSVRAALRFAREPRQPSLDMPETLWKSYIDFEINQGENERTRALYRALLERTKHVKVWTCTLMDFLTYDDARWQHTAPAIACNALATACKT